MGLAVKRRNCGNLLNDLQNREVGGGLVCSVEGRLHVVKLKKCNVNRCAEKFVRTILVSMKTLFGQSIRM